MPDLRSVGRPAEAHDRSVGIDLLDTVVQGVADINRPIGSNVESAHAVERTYRSGIRGIEIVPGDRRDDIVRNRNSAYGEFVTDKQVAVVVCRYAPFPSTAPYDKWLPATNSPLPPGVRRRTVAPPDSAM